MRRLSCLILLPACVAPLVAQVEIAPYVGAFMPLGNGWTQDFGGTRQAERRQIGTLTVGARLSYWTGRRLGVEATVAFAPSQVAVTDLGKTRDINAGVVLSSVRVVTRLATLVDGDSGSGPTHWHIDAGLGLGVIARGGSAWANITGTTQPAAVLSLETGTPVGEAVTMRVGVADFVSWATFDRGLPGETRSRVQHDVIVTLATQVRLGSHGGAAR